ncbi:hypothetical protein O0L34_g4798 [Tuta absoluta]|nr:hypothetical protein O0L34_g4798 [Tuta absoluta]
MPDKDPVIIGAPKLVQPGEQMLLNCTTDYSLPHSEINWYIDNELQKPEPWQHTEHSLPQEGGLRASWRILRVRVPASASGALRIRCEAVLQVEPPVVRDAVTTITVYSRTELSKYVSSDGTSHTKGTSANYILFTLIWTCKVGSRFLSL